MAPHHALILGGHGQVAQMLTRNLLHRAWNVTSVLRAPRQVPMVEALSADKPGTLKILIQRLHDVQSEEEASTVVKSTEADMVVWAAGAGEPRPNKRISSVDRETALHFIKASAGLPSVTRFLMISYLGSRRQKPAWWDEHQWASMQQKNHQGSLSEYYQAKIAADEELFRQSKKRGPDFAGLCLRPGLLTDDPMRGVVLGKTSTSSGSSSRESVAAAADALLAADDAKTSWVDMMDGDEDIDTALKRVVAEGVDAMDGEPVLQET